MDRNPPARQARLLPLTILMLSVLTGGWGARGWAEQIPSQKTSLWRIDGENGATPGTVYLAGALHALRPSDLPLPGQFLGVYQQASRIFFEADPSAAGAASASRTQGLMGEPLSALITPQTEAKLKRYLNDNPSLMPWSNDQTPIMLSIGISSWETSKLGARRDLGIEHYFYHHQEIRGKQIFALERVEDQFRILYELTSKQQELMLNEAIDSAPSKSEWFANLVAAWKGGDTTRLDELLNETFDPGIYDHLIASRNRIWMTAILNEVYYGRGQSMFVVGVAHLVGKGSIIALLEANGCRPVQL
jgi:uncharacterized protein YbaP (TraB family)